jgi:hypothetical protein
VAMVRIYLECDEPVLSQSPAVLNPTFAGSIELGGADADLILGNTLIDIKTTKKGKPNRPQYWQIVGYALADYTNEYGIERVGFYYARYGALVTWTLDDLLHRLAAKPVDIAHLRSDFKQLLGTLAVRRPRFFDVAGSRAPRTTYVPVGQVVQRAVKFRPPASGSGKWHAPYSEVPGQSRPDDLKFPGRTPACGSKAMLAASSETITPAVGSKYADADSRICRRCLGYTWSWYGERWWGQTRTTDASTLSFRPPTSGSGKWHIVRIDMYPMKHRHPNIPICGSGADIDMGAEAIPFGADVSAMVADPRVCGHCLREARKAAQMSRGLRSND